MKSLGHCEGEGGVEGVIYRSRSPWLQAAGYCCRGAVWSLDSGASIGLRWAPRCSSAAWGCPIDAGPKSGPGGDENEPGSGPGRSRRDRRVRVCEGVDNCRGAAFTCEETRTVLLSMGCWLDRSFVDPVRMLASDDQGRKCREQAGEGLGGREGGRWDGIYTPSHTPVYPSGSPRQPAPDETWREENRSSQRSHDERQCMDSFARSRRTIRVDWGRLEWDGASGRRAARVGFRGRTQRLAQVPWASRPSPASGHPSRCLLDRTGPPARRAGRPVTWKPGAGQYLQSTPHQVGTSYTSRAQEGWACSSCSDGPSCSPNSAPFQHGDADSPRRSDGACDCGMYSIDCVREAHPQARPFSFVCVCAAVERCASRPVCVVVTWFGSHAKFRTVM